MKTYRIATIPGDGIGKEVVPAGQQVLEVLAARSDNVVQGDAGRYVTLARFFAENVTVQSGALERAVIDSADAVNCADAVLVA